MHAAFTLLSATLAGCGGGSSSSSAASAPAVSVTNNAPVAAAGVDQQVYENSTVTLLGSGTDSDGTIVSYQWTQISGAARSNLGKPRDCEQLDNSTRTRGPCVLLSAAK